MQISAPKIIISKTIHPQVPDYTRKSAYCASRSREILQRHTLHQESLNEPLTAPIPWRTQVTANISPHPSRRTKQSDETRWITKDSGLLGTSISDAAIVWSTTTDWPAAPTITQRPCPYMKPREPILHVFSGYFYFVQRP